MIFVLLPEPPLLRMSQRLVGAGQHHSGPLLEQSLEHRPRMDGQLYRNVKFGNRRFKIQHCPILKSSIFKRNVCFEFHNLDNRNSDPIVIFCVTVCYVSGCLCIVLTPGEPPGVADH